MGNLRRRVEKLERANGAGAPPLIIILKSFGELTPEETAALEAHKERMEAEGQGGCVVVVDWT